MGKTDSKMSESKTTKGPDQESGSIPDNVAVDQATLMTKMLEAMEKMTTSFTDLKSSLESHRNPTEDQDRSEERGRPGKSNLDGTTCGVNQDNYQSQAVGNTNRGPSQDNRQ